MDPINYNLNVINPLQMALEGYQAGQGMASSAQDARAAEQNMGIQANQEARAAEEFQLRKADAERQRAAQEHALAEAKRGQDAMVALAMNQQPTADDFRAAMAANPGTAMEIRGWWDAQTADQQKNNAGFGKQIAFALGNGNTDAAKAMLQQRLDAAVNAGNAQEADTIKSQIQMIDMGEDGARGLLMTTLGGLSTVMPADEFNTFMATALPDKSAAEIAALNAQKTQAEIDKLKAEASALAEKKGGLEPKDKADLEYKLNNQYSDRSKGFRDSRDAFVKIKEAANANSGAGDVALITSFMKMLDPGSVVRETEFAIARDTNGLYQALQGALSKVSSGELLTPEARQNYLDLSSKYMEAANKADEETRKSLLPMVNQYGLSEDAVFGSGVQGYDAGITPPAAPVVAAPAVPPAPVVPSVPIVPPVSAAPPASALASRKYMVPKYGVKP